MVKPNPFTPRIIIKNNRNLIVGDPKQSIYRFNNGLADQFVSLPAIYNPEQNALTQTQSDYFNSRGALRTLTNNYRSSKQIVAFNNAFLSNSFLIYQPNQLNSILLCIKNHNQIKRASFAWCHKQKNHVMEI